VSKNTLEHIEKSGLSAKAKTAMGEAMKCLQQAKGDMPSDQWKAFRKAFSFEEEPEEDAEKEKEKEKAKKSADAFAAMTEAVKKSVSDLNGPTPNVMSALNALAPLVGLTPTHQVIAALPPEVRAQVEAIQKSASDSAAQLAEMKKSIETQGRTLQHKELVQKAAETFKHVPGSAEDIATIQMVLPAAEVKRFNDLLTSIEGAMSKSALFEELGSSVTSEASKHSVTQGGSVAYEEASRMATDLVQKSGGKVTFAKAVSDIFTNDPELSARHENERRSMDRAR